MTPSQFYKRHRLPDEVMTQGLRPMELDDVEAVTAALNKHLADNYVMHIKFTPEEVQHFFMRREQVVYSWLVRDAEGTVTDFFSFYALNSSVLQHETYDKIFAAYAFYNFCQDNDQERLRQIFKDGLILANQLEFDVFNMTEVLKNHLVKGDLLFKPGDGRLHHYLYNWRVKTMKCSEIGIVLV